MLMLTSTGLSCLEWHSFTSIEPSPASLGICCRIHQLLSPVFGKIIGIVVVDDHLTTSSDSYTHQLFCLAVLVNRLPFEEEIARLSPLKLVGHLGNIDAKDALMIGQELLGYWADCLWCGIAS